MKGLLIGMLFGIALGVAGFYVVTYYEHRQVLQELAAQPGLEPSVIDAFRFTVEEEVKKKLGQPIEGFEPQMFLEVFPGLAVTDFDTVLASAGSYEVENGELVFVPDPAKLQHSASGAIGKDGLATLLENVAVRTKIDLNATGTLTDIMRVITAQ